MKRKQKALLLSTLCSLALLTGCKDESPSKESVESKTRIYVNVPNDMELNKKVFEPGEHIIYYEQRTVDESRASTDEDNWTNGLLEIPETPEGYYLFQIIPHDGRYGPVGMVYVYINDKTVEATPTYNSIYGTVEYETPGVVVDTIKLVK